MGNLFGSLLGAAGSLRVYEQALAVSQNNVSNALTPGYASQRLQLAARTFRPDAGQAGGVEAAGVTSARDWFAEWSVRWRSQSFGRASQSAVSLSRLEPALPIGAGAGVPAALDELFQSFSALSVAPNDLVARQAVIDGAGGFARAMNGAAASLVTASTATGQEMGAAVSRINDLAARIHELDLARRSHPAAFTDAGIDAQLHQHLEELSGLVDYTLIQQSDGSIAIYLGGLTPLVMGADSYPITVDLSAGSAVIRDSQGHDVTANIREGSLAALVDVRNNHIPSYLNDLNRLAGSVAEQVNALQRAGLDINGQTPAQDIFIFGSGADAALTLTAAPLTPQEIAAASAGAPGGNGNALAFAALGEAPAIDGMTFVAFYGNTAARLGRDVSAAREDEATESLLLMQAREFRAEVSSVSLDEEAAHIIEFQTAYEASARLLTVLDELTETVLGMIR